MELLPEKWFQIAFDYIFKLAPEFAEPVAEFKVNLYCHLQRNDII